MSQVSGVGAMHVCLFVTRFPLLHLNVVCRLVSLPSQPFPSGRGVEPVKLGFKYEFEFRRD